MWLQAKLDPASPNRPIKSLSPSLSFVILSVGTILKGLPAYGDKTAISSFNPPL